MNPTARRAFIERLLIADAIIGLSILCWMLRHVVILAFAAMLLAIFLDAVSRGVRALVRLPMKLALVVSILLLVGLAATGTWFFGQTLAAEFGATSKAIPTAVQSLVGRLQGLGIDLHLHRLASQAVQKFMALSKIGGIAMWTATTVTETVFVLAAAIYFAASPALYRAGFAKLIPPERRALAMDTLDTVTSALRRWLLGQFVAMIAIGVISGVGLWIIGAPAALAMGVLAGCLEFIPYLGPILSGIPPVLLALDQDPSLAIWILGLYLLVHQLENNLLQPLIQRWTINIPPVLLLLGVIAMGTLFGLAGVIFAAPLVVAVYVLVKRLYVREALDTFTPLPGETR